MTEVEYGGGGHHTQLRQILGAFGVPLAHVYKGGRGGRPASLGAPKGGGILLLVGVGFILS